MSIEENCWPICLIYLFYLLVLSIYLKLFIENIILLMISRV